MDEGCSKLSKVASLILVSKRTVQRYTDRFRATGTVSPFVQKNGPDRVLSNDDDANTGQTWKLS